MSDDPIRFDDGAAYERMMGVWSRLVGEEFLAWLAPEPALRWLDVGCGNGAFTELLAERCAPASILGVDPSEGQLAFARSRHSRGVAEFRQGNAMALPCEADSVDAAVMALVIFFVAEPAQGVAEMLRVVKPGGIVCAYAWDLLEPGGFPMQPMQQELRGLSIEPMMPPRAEVSRMNALRDLWADAGLLGIETRDITVSRSFDGFDDFWASVEIALGMAPSTHALPAATKDALKARLRARLPEDESGCIAYMSRANAIVGRVPARCSCS